MLSRKLTELRRFPRLSIASRGYYAKMLDPDYYKVLLEIGIRAKGSGNPILLPRNLTPSTCEWSGRCDNFSVEASWKNFEEITPTDDKTPIAVEIIGQVNLTN